MNRQAEERPKLQDFFERGWDRDAGPLRLDKAEASRRFQRFVDAAYDAPETAVEIAREDTIDLAINQRPLLKQIGILLAANNPSRAAKLYTVAVTSRTGANAKKFRAVLLSLGAALGLGILAFLAFFIGGFIYIIWAVS